jgi:GNAT superfamily N-acetyltransferase
MSGATGKATGTTGKLSGTTGKTGGRPAISVVPANRGSWDDLQTVFGERGEAHRCQCQWFKVPAAEWRALGLGDRAERLRGQTDCGAAESGSSSGLVAYLEDEPVGWCAIEPRTSYPRLLNSRVPWSGREESKDDAGVWAVTCFVTRTGYRRRGVSRALAAAAVDYAKQGGARAIEGYPIVVRPGQEFSWGELYVGSRGIFADAGFREVSRPTERRVVMRLELIELCAPESAGAPGPGSRAPVPSPELPVAG